MDTHAFGTGITYMANDRGLPSFQAWEAQYEAFGVQDEWWFRAGAALVRWTRSVIGGRAATPRLRLARA